MHVHLHRKALKDDYTIGDIYINGILYGNTLEDKDRGLDQKLPLSQNKKLKVYGQTAIPVGTYKVGVYYWSKYRKEYPHIKNVPAFEGILIHKGTNKDHTLGCILVGRNSSIGKLTDDGSCDKVINMILNAIKNNDEEVVITIGYTKPVIVLKTKKPTSAI